MPFVWRRSIPALGGPFNRPREPMLLIVIKKIAVVLVSSGVGLVAGTIVATPVIAVMNYRATDGPYFPAPLVALGLLALPIGCLLFLMQASVVAYEAIARRSLG